jgi:hypothetical protein
VNHETKYQVGRFHVWWDTEIPGLDGKSVKNGFHIQTEVDPRWTFDDENSDFFVAAIHSNDSVIIGLPAISYDHLYNIESFIGNSLCVSKDMDENRNKILPNLVQYKKVPMMWYLLQFPPRPGMTGVRLSVREIHLDPENLQDDTTLELKYYPNISNHHKTGIHASWWATWNVVANDIGEKDMSDRKRGAPNVTPKKSKAFTQAAAFVEKLYGVKPDTPMS